MSDPNRMYEIRCPVHGFIPFSDWERDVINHPAFQRLRRIRQLAWTDYVYPGAMHTRFEHSLGVMHIAGQLFESIRRRSFEVLKSDLGFSDDDLARDRQIVRFTALLHDTGHGPFSHAAEDVFPTDAKGKHYKHEAYSAAVIRHVLKDVIESHPLNRGVGILADDIATLLEGGSAAGGRLFWRQLVDGQMDADRMDYLLRDSLHIGVDYGRYDWRRLLNTIQVVQMEPRRGEESPPGPRIGVAEGGVHAAEALVLARYYMFTQVYFHKTRVAYDHHIRGSLKALLPTGAFPPPSAGTIAEYLQWNDWKVLGLLADESNGGEHADRLRRRDHYREIHHTPEHSVGSERTVVGLISRSLGNLVAAVESSETSTYKLGPTDISVVSEAENHKVQPLSEYSSVLKGFKDRPVNMVRLYSRPEDAEQARLRIAELLRGSL